MKKIALSCFIFFVTFSASPADKRDILLSESKAIDLEISLIRDFSEVGLPAYSDRQFWDNLPENYRSQYIQEAEEKLIYDWPVVKATDYLEIIRSGDRRQDAYAAPKDALLALAMGELVEGEGRFMDQIINGAWYYCEQTWWGWSAHLPQPMGLPDIDHPSIDLGVGEIANILSWTWYLFHNSFDKIHPFISKRLKDEIMRKAILPYYKRDDFWWMGFDGGTVNNWNPWTNHNMLTAILIIEDDHEKKIEGVLKVIRSLDIFLNHYPPDGGCDEGPSYWGRAGASLYQNLDLLKLATRGQFNVYDHQLIRNMGSYIYKAYIDYPYFINFADADATTGSRPQIIYSYGKDIQDPIMQKFGAFLADRQNWGSRIPDGKIDEQIIQLLLLDEIKNAPAENALIPDFWLPDTQIAGARDQAGASHGFFFAAKGGHNAESHNHNDLGTCVLYYNGKPCLIDIGRETYVAKTFSSQRYEIWTMQSQYHNLPRINGIDQKDGRQFTASNTSFRADGSKALFSTDIASAYPVEAGVDKWIRGYRLDRGKKFTISDSYELNNIGTEPSTINFVTYCKVKELAPGKLGLTGNGFELVMEYNPRQVKPEIEFFEVNDTGLKRYWPEGITRIVFTINELSHTGHSKIIIQEAR